MRNIKTQSVGFVWLLLVLFFLTGCQAGKVGSAGDEGDTLSMKYSQLLQLVKHDGYTEAIIANPWKSGSELHRYLLVPKGKEGDEKAAELKRSLGAQKGMTNHTDVVRTPIASSVIYTAPHCQLIDELGAKNAITGVCDLDYINIPDIKRRAALTQGKDIKGTPAHQGIVDCGSSMQPTIERIIALQPEALLISPFENSGGYGKIEKLGIPIIETADYMETSPLGRAEWIKFYGLLFQGEGEKNKAAQLFSSIEKQYLSLKSQAAKLPKGLSVLTERKTGSVWYVPGGNSTMGILLRDAHAGYAFANDKHSGSLALSPEQVVAKGNEIEVWAFKYFGGKPLNCADLLQEYPGYKSLRAFGSKNIYECDTQATPYFEMTSFHPEILLREFIILSHPKAKGFGDLRFYHKLTI